MCSPKHEAAPFVLDHNAVAPIPVLNDICQKKPVHVVFGEINDMLCVTFALNSAGRKTLIMVSQF